MKNKRHILFLSSWYPSRVSPTDGNFVKRHAEAVAMLHNVKVVYAIGDIKKETNNYEICNESKNGVNNIIIYYKKHRFFLINAYRKLLAYKKGMSQVKVFDVIHANVLYPIGILAFFLKLIYSKPLIFTEHWTGYFHPKKSNLNVLKRFMIRVIGRQANFVAPVSSVLKDAMLNMGIQTNYQVIGNAVDTNLFCPKEKNNDIFRIVHISTLDDKHKNIKGLLEVIYQISTKRQDFIIQIIGDKNIEETKNSIKNIGIPSQLIDLQGVKTPEQIASILQNADLYVSFSNYETFGVVYIEALATETPVISTNTGILTEFDIKDSYKIIPIKDKEKLKTYIEGYLDGIYKIDRENMRSFAVENFSFMSIAKQYNQIYNTMLNYE